MPARKIRPSRYSITGYVPSKKGVKVQDAESSLEQDFLTLLEFDPRVERYVAQPFTIEWRDAIGKKRHYTPDVVVKYSDLAKEKEPWLKTTVFEVKPINVLKADWKEFRPKFKSTIGWAKQYDCLFHVVTENHIRTPYLDNARLLLRFKSHFFDVEPSLAGARQHHIIRTLVKLGETTPNALLENLSADIWLRAELIPWIWNLVNQNIIGVDLHQPLTMKSKIWPTSLAKKII